MSQKHYALCIVLLAHSVVIKQAQQAINIGEEKLFSVLLESDLKVVCKFLFGSGALLFDVQQLPVVVQHDHQLVGVTQTQIWQNRCILQVFSTLLIGQKSLQEATCKHNSKQNLRKRKSYQSVYLLLYVPEQVLSVHLPTSYSLQSFGLERTTCPQAP